MKLKLSIILVFCIFIVRAQQMPNDGFNKVRIVLTDRIISAELNPVDHQTKGKPDRLYFWYSGNVINATQGGYSGQLLNGPYSEYFPNKNLKTQGMYIDGLKEGLWNTWTEQGTLINSYTWKKGAKNGNYAIFNLDGKPVEGGVYRNNLLNGPVTYYRGKDSLKTVYYKNGIVFTHRSFIQRINILKKKHK